MRKACILDGNHKPGQRALLLQGKRGSEKTPQP